MMGRLNHDQEQFFYSFRLDEAVPDVNLAYRWFCGLSIEDKVPASFGVHACA